MPIVHDPDFPYAALSSSALTQDAVSADTYGAFRSREIGAQRKWWFETEAQRDQFITDYAATVDTP